MLYIVFLYLQIDFVLANSVYPSEMLQNVAFHQGIPCLSMYQLRGFHYTMGPEL